MRNIRSFGKQEHNEDLCLIIDDSVIEGPCTKKANNCTWTFDHNKMKSVKAITVYSCLLQMDTQLYRLEQNYWLQMKTL